MNPADDPIAKRFLELAQALEGAMAVGELSVEYQPKVSLTNGRVMGGEALLRWRSPEFGNVVPSEIIAAAETHDQVDALGAWVLDHVCAQIAAWKADSVPMVRISVNLAPVQFRRGDIAQRIRQTLSRFGVSPDCLGVEVTESALLGDTGEVTQALRDLQSAGVEIALDDFGTGYSNLSRLRELPIDLVKLDRSYVPDVTAALTSASITRSIIHLAHGLHLKVVAEGVETEQQVKLLLKNGCDHIQGWYVAKALRATEFAALLAEGPALPAELTYNSHRPKTLLLVDDEVNILSALKRVFRRENYKVHTASSGQEALEVLTREPVDVILSDQRMPGMTGVEFLRIAKERYPDTVRMTLSGYTDLQTIIDAVNEGAIYRFLTKPWDDARLRDHVAQAFVHHELAEENRRLSREISTANAELAEANRRLEYMVEREHERVSAMLTAAGRTRDMMDLLPLAIIGIDEDCATPVYVNALARKYWPQLTVELGTGPSDSAVQLLRAAGEAQSQGGRMTWQGLGFKCWLLPMKELDPEGMVAYLIVLLPVFD